MHHTIPSPPHCRSAHWHQHIEPQTQTTTFLSLICPNFLSAHRPEWREWRNHRDQIYGWQLMVFWSCDVKKSKSKCFYSQHFVGGKTVGSQGVPCPPRRRWSLAGLRSCGATNHEDLDSNPEVYRSLGSQWFRSYCKVYDVNMIHMQEEFEVQIRKSSLSKWPMKRDWPNLRNSAFSCEKN